MTTRVFKRVDPIVMILCDPTSIASPYLFILRENALWFFCLLVCFFFVSRVTTGTV